MPDPVTTTDANSLLEHLPPDVIGYVVLALIMWWVMTRTYKDNNTDRDQMIERLEDRLDQTEDSLAAMTQGMADKDDKIAELISAVAELRVELAQSKAAEHSCAERMERLEGRYEKRIAELEHEIDQLRGDISEPIDAGMP